MNNIRVLVCRNCRTIEVLPDFTGEPDNDDTLRWAAEPHNKQGHLGNLILVPETAWGDPDIRAEIIVRLTGKDSTTGLPREVYEIRHNTMDDAMDCWRKHLRPEDSCPDYWSDSKILKPDTADLRKDLGITKRDADPAKEIRLCQFCPIHVKVLERKKILLGLYK